MTALNPGLKLPDLRITRVVRAAIRASGLFKDSLDAAPLLDIEGPGVWQAVMVTYILVPR